jgi:N-acylneuraminate cytidylyltransferase
MVVDEQPILLFAMDCDGVLTDGGMYYSENGDELKRFNTVDGMAIALLRELGVKTAIITGETTEIVRRRAQKLKIDYCRLGVSTSKLEALREIADKEGIAMSQVVYIGDDLWDIECVENCGFGVAVANAQPPVQAVAKYITTVPGGSGAVREVVEYLKAKGLLGN